MYIKYIVLCTIIYMQKKNKNIFYVNRFVELNKSRKQSSCECTQSRYICLDVCKWMQFKTH